MVRKRMPDRLFRWCVGPDRFVATVAVLGCSPLRLAQIGWIDGERFVTVSASTATVPRASRRAVSEFPASTTVWVVPLHATTS